MVTHIATVRINRVRLPNLLVVSWTEKWIFPCPRSRLKIWPRETASAVLSRVSLLISVLRLNLVLTHGIPPEFRGGVHIRHTPSVQFRVYQVTRLRTDGVHCRESSGTGPENLKVVPNECCLARSPWTTLYAPIFPTTTTGMKWVQDVESTGGNRYHWSLNTPREDQCEWHRMTWMTRPSCAVMCNLINTHWSPLGRTNASAIQWRGWQGRIARLCVTKIDTQTQLFPRLTRGFGNTYN